MIRVTRAPTSTIQLLLPFLRHSTTFIITVNVSFTPTLTYQSINHAAPHTHLSPIDGHVRDIPRRTGQRQAEVVAPSSAV
ncbi:hypothetical protein EV363DRAFT_1335784 [Boletus edulis]|uniref:Uncharacterized protein n=1 Tax=Boletus edulis BED1 TaxID=1328754 RepID=A0AAD4BSZ9_BOLED|nr:hypothetical protein EV363DRAFT_1335784 [Boletus edulis]KAF8438582.1 hypothetical protein L210DRAFT_3544457 [Boletus edulis BED1]